MKLPAALLCCLVYCTYSYANYSIEGAFAELSIQTEGKMILIPGEVDGIEGFFLLDTGASELILNERYFSNARSGKKKLLQDIGEKRYCGLVQVDHFMMGQVYRDHFRVAGVDLSPTEKSIGRKILGLLGYDLLRHFEIRIDYYAGFILFCALDERGYPLTKWQRKPADHHLDFTMEGHLPTIQGQLLGQKHLTIGLDSGASVNLMDRSYRGYLKRNCLKERKIDFQGVHTKVEQAPFFVMRQLAVEQAYWIQFWRTSIGDFSHLHDSNIYIQVILGANFFQLGRMAINYRLKTIDIWDEPKRLNRRYNCSEH